MQRWTEFRTMIIDVHEINFRRQNLKTIHSRYVFTFKKLVNKSITFENVYDSHIKKKKKKLK
jgi:hypothetical protein